MQTAKRTLLPMLVAVLAMTSAWAAGDDEAAKKELKQFQGNWKLVGGRGQDGNEITEVDRQMTRLTVDGNKFTLTLDVKTKVNGTFKVDPAKTPHTIDVTLDGGQKMLGIYEIKAGIRKSCFADVGKERPAKFTTEKGYITFEWKRE